MSNHRKGRSSHQSKKFPPPLDAKSKSTITGRKRWCFRLLAMVTAPVVFCLLLEMGLRFGGFGHPTSFLLPSSNAGRNIFIQNNQFGWRFFGPQMARTPEAFSISRTRPPGTLRIFVFGGSAAFGDPQPDFGLSRMLQVMLSQRYPGVRFEVVNAAMTGINSHVVLSIARDCARADGDLWVIYMGNNEVVGPFGAGTVFGSQSPPLPLIRASLALKTTRTGELLDALRRQLQKPPPGKSEWGGMEMFLNHQVRADDPRMANVYHHFKANLADILQAGHNAGAGIVVSTVAVNLKDSAPFASEHRPGLPEADKAKWEQLVQLGGAAQADGNISQAAEQFREAAQIDDSYAELRFRQAQCALAAGDVAEAQKQFAAARDLDTLRFRCDRRLNELIRESASGRGRDHILLADAEHAFAEQSANGLPGQKLFYEHVHLTFSGNYLLARIIAAQIEKLLPESVIARQDANAPWPSEADCARRLAWTGWNQQAALTEVLGRLTDPPFTGRLNQSEQMRQLKSAMAKLATANQPAALAGARNIYENAIAKAPDDPVLRSGLASLETAARDLASAETNALHAVELLPSSSEDWALLGGILAAQQKFPDAVTAFRKAFQLDSEDVWSLYHLAESLKALGRRNEAEEEFRHAVAVKPRFGLGWLGLGLMVEEDGHKDEAKVYFRKAVANPIHRTTELVVLAKFCQSRGWFSAAATNYFEAIKIGLPDSMLHLYLGQCFTAMKQHTEAEQQYADAVRLSPDSMAAHYLLGLEVLREGKLAEGEEQFRTAVRLAPDLVEARLNLGLVLMNEGRNDEALAEFEEVLKRAPQNAVAAQKIKALRGKPSL